MSKIQAIEFANDMYNDIFFSPTNKEEAEKGAIALINDKDIDTITDTQWVATPKDGMQLYQKLCNESIRSAVNYTDDICFRLDKIHDYRESYFKEMELCVMRDLHNYTEYDIHSIFKERFLLNIDKDTLRYLFENMQYSIANSFNDSEFLCLCLYLYEEKLVNFGHVIGDALEAFEAILVYSAGMFYISNTIILVKKPANVVTQITKIEY